MITKLVNGVEVEISAQEHQEWLASLVPSVSEQAARIVDKFESEIALITAGYTDSEIKSWDQQLEEARRYLADSSAHVPLLSALATSREVPLQDLATRVVTKADMFAAAFGAALGRKQKALDDLGVV